MAWVHEFHPETVRYILRTDPSKRVSLGQFFTPRTLRIKLLTKLPKLRNPRVLDPACGSGEFLLSAKEYFINPELHCWEIDPELASIAKKVVPEANVEVVDSLTKPFEEKFDIVLGNPPYYEFKPTKEIRKKFQEIIYGRVNIYALFVYLGIKMLKPGGYLAYVISSSMNNGAYFKKLREFIVRNANIEYLEVLSNPYIFSDSKYRVNHTFQLIIIRKVKNKGNYIFRYKNILIFTEKYKLLKKVFKTAVTLEDLGYKVMTGKVVWNQHKDKLTNNPRDGILLIWSHNIKHGKLILKNDARKPQYIRWSIEKADKGPAIVVTRVVGHPKKAVLEAALVPPNVLFVAENHVNVIYPPKTASIKEMVEIVKQLNSREVNNIIREITGNTQLSKTELEKLVPLKIRRYDNRKRTLLEYLHQIY